MKRGKETKAIFFLEILYVVVFIYIERVLLSLEIYQTSVGLDIDVTRETE